MAEVETWKEGEFYLCEAWGRESGLNGSLVLTCWLLCIHTLPWLSLWAFWAWEAEEWTERESSFFLSWFHDRLDFPLRQACFYATFSALFPFFSSPPSLSLSSASGQPVRFSEWLSPLRLRGLVKTVRLLPVSSRHKWRTQSPPLHCSAACGPRVPGGETINHSPRHLHCNGSSVRCWCNASMDAQTEISAVILNIVGL